MAVLRREGEATTGGDGEIGDPKNTLRQAAMEDMAAVHWIQQAANRVVLAGAVPRETQPAVQGSQAEGAALVAEVAAAGGAAGASATC